MNIGSWYLEEKEMISIYFLDVSLFFQYIVSKISNSKSWFETMDDNMSDYRKLREGW